MLWAHEERQTDLTSYGAHWIFQRVCLSPVPNWAMLVASYAWFCGICFARLSVQHEITCSSSPGHTWMVELVAEASSTGFAAHSYSALEASS